MKKRLLTFLCLLLVVALLGFLGKSLFIWPDAISGASFSMETNGNSLYHQTEIMPLTVGSIEVRGEVENPGLVHLNEFYKREVYVKELVPDEDGIPHFRGAFRYQGYALFDLLHPHRLAKENMEIFPPVIDLYVVISNKSGESVTFSWSEIFHTAQPYQIILATGVAPIEPKKVKPDYETGRVWRVVAAGDFYAFRILDDPVSIAIYSFSEKDYTVNRDLKPLFSPEISVSGAEVDDFVISPFADSSTFISYRTSFYGMGMGYHDQKVFSGPGLAGMLEGSMELYNPGMMRNGLVCFAGADGYRAVYSYSELFNRADHAAPILSVSIDQMNGGYYRIFLPTDYYADRCVKAVAEIFFFKGRSEK
jgi:hypothetical protein